MNLQEAIQKIKTGTGSLDLRLHYQKIGDSEVAQLGKAIVISKLTSLTLNLSSNQIKNVDELGKGLAVNTKLTSLYLHLSNNQIKNVDELGKAIAVNTKLTSLKLNFYNNQIINVDELGKAIAVNTKLTSLELNFYNNQIKNVDELGKAIAVNTKLTSLKLKLNNNQITNEETKILSDFIKKSSVQITLDYSNNNISEEEKKALKSALALNKDAKYREEQKLEKQKPVKTKIGDINFDTEKNELDSIKKLATQFDLIKEFDKKFNEIKNQLQDKINNINTTYSRSNITILNKQAKNYGLGKNAATKKFNEVKDDKYLKFIELQDNTVVKTTLKSEECFKIFDQQDIQMCLKGMDKQVISKEKVDQCKQESDCIYQKYWIIKKDYYIQDSNNFLKICLDEFAAEQFVPCNNYDSKKAISRSIQNLDIQMQSIAIFSSEKCFSVFKLENLEMCYRRTKTQILPKSSVDPCYDPNLCMYSPSWSISTDENLLSFEDYFRVCKEEFENKNFISCDDQISSWVDWLLIIKVGFAAGVIIGGMYLCKKCLPFLAGAGQLPLEQQVGDNE